MEELAMNIEEPGRCGQVGNPPNYGHHQFNSNGTCVWCGRSEVMDWEIKAHAMQGVADHRKWELLDMEVKWRRAENNYAGTMLELATKKLKEHNDEKKEAN